MPYFLIKDIAVIKTTIWELVNIKPFLLFSQKNNFNKTKLNDQLPCSLQVFNQTKRIIKEKHFYNNLKHELFKKLGQ